MDCSRIIKIKARNILYNNQNALLSFNTHSNYYSEHSINYVIDNDGLISFNAALIKKPTQVRITIFQENRKAKLKILGQLQPSDNLHTRYKQFFSAQKANTNNYTVKIQYAEIFSKKQTFIIPVDYFMITTCFSEEEEKKAIKNINACLTCTPYWPKRAMRILSFTSEGLWFNQKNKITYIQFNSNIKHVSLIKSIIIALQRSQFLYEMKKNHI
jgi:hypothetical protein